MNPTINTTSKYDKWWRSAGQFLQPADIATPEKLKYLKSFGASMFEYFNAEISELKADLEESEKNADERVNDLKQTIEDIVAGDHSDSEKLADIKSKVE